MALQYRYIPPILGCSVWVKVNNLNNTFVHRTPALRILGILFCLLYMPLSAMANIQVGGITIASETVLEGQTLTLNGAGFRSIFLMDIYLVSLYLIHPSGNADSIIQHSRPAQLRMEFLHGGAGRDMLAKGWRKGFERNQAGSMMLQLEARLKKFSDLFGNVQKGDLFVFDFLSNGDTRISYNDHMQGMIHGPEFQQALLAIWLGRHPVEDVLKKELLQHKSNKERMK